MRSSMTDVLDTNTPRWQIIWSLAWPAILEQVLQVLVNYVDSAMVGSLGAEATAAISLNISTIWLVNGFMYAVATGFAVLMAHRIGSGDRDEANHVIRVSLVAEAACGLGLVLLFSTVARILPAAMHADISIRQDATDYLSWIAYGYLSTMLMIGLSSMLRLSGDTRTPLVLGFLNNLLNIIFNALFIYPSLSFGSIRIPTLGCGVKGAAMGTSLSAAITTALLFLSLSDAKRKARILWKQSWKPDKSILSKGFRLAVPIMLERCTLSLGQIVLTGMVTSLGVTAMAAHYLANTAEQVGFLPPSGFAVAATTLTAQSLGADRPELAKDYASACLKSGCLLMLGTASLLFLFAPELIGLFTRDAEVVVLGAFVLRIEAFGQPGLSVQQLVSGTLRGAGDTKMPFAISLLGMWIIRLPLAWMLLHVFGFGLEGVWIAMMTDLNVRGIVAFRYYRTGRWLRAWQTKR